MADLTVKVFLLAILDVFGPSAIAFVAGGLLGKAHGFPSWSMYVSIALAAALHCTRKARKKMSS